MSAETVRAAITAAGGLTKFIRKMGRGKGAEDSIRLILNGGRVPSTKFREDMIAASDGVLTHEDIIEITGQSEASSAPGPRVDVHWEADEDLRRAWIAQKASAGARAQRLANRSAP